MTLKQRLDEIRRIIKQDKKVVVSELSRQFDVTEETIRRDLDKLEAEGLIARTYGGAVLNQDNFNENVDFMRRAQTNSHEKQIISRFAKAIIPVNATISADASSTVAEFLKALGDRPEMTVLTYSIKAIETLSETGIKVISTGGLVNKSICAFKGAITQKNLDSYHTEYAVFSCKAISMRNGIFDSNEEEVELKKIMLNRGQKSVLLVDHTKFDRLAFVKLADFSEIDILVTDREPSPEWCAYLKEQNVTVVWHE